MKLIIYSALIFSVGDLSAQSEFFNSFIQNSPSSSFIDIIFKNLTKPLLGSLIIFLLLLSIFLYKEKKFLPFKLSFLNLTVVTFFSLLLDSFSWSKYLPTSMMGKLIIIFIALNIFLTLSLFLSLGTFDFKNTKLELSSLKKCSQFLFLLVPIIFFLPIPKSSGLILFTGLSLIFVFFIYQIQGDEDGIGIKDKIFNSFKSMSTSILFIIGIFWSLKISAENQNIILLPILVFLYLTFLYYLFKNNIKSFCFKSHFTTPLFFSSLIFCAHLFLEEPIKKDFLFLYLASFILFQFCFLFYFYKLKKIEINNWLNILKNELREMEEKQKKALKEAENNLFKLEVQEMNTDEMMDTLYEQKKARETILNCLYQGVISFNKDGYVLEGSTKVAEKLLSQNLFESELLEIKIENILNLSKEKKAAFKKNYANFFNGKMDFNKFKELAPNLFHDSKRKNIFLEYVPYQTDEEGEIDRIIILITDKTKEIESDKAIAEREYELEMSKMELEYMMEHLYEQKHKRDVLIDNLKEGYLTVNKDGIIEEGASSACHELFGISLYESELKKIKFSELWKKNASRRDHIKKWIKTIWSGSFQFKDLVALAPKKFDERTDRYIELEYRPIFDSEDGKQNEKGDLPIKNIIVIASDKTTEMKLLEKINKDKEEAYFIKTCLQNPEEFLDLINESYSFLIDRPEIDMLTDHKELYFRKFHTMKAQYAQFKIRNISKILHMLEESLEEENWEVFFKELDHLEKNMNDLFSEHRLLIQAANKLLLEHGNSIASKDIINHIKEVDSLEELQHLIREKYILKDFKGQFKKFEALIDELAKELDKSVVMEFRGDDILIDTEKYQSFFNTSIHLFRNIMDHGIETKDERIEKNKNESGLIIIKAEKKKNRIFLTIKDDGKGIDPVNVKIKVLEKQLKEPKDLDILSDDEIIDFIFLPGFSTRESIDHISGRGVGTDAVRYEVEKLGGTIRVKSTLDVETVFTIVLPILS